MNRGVRLSSSQSLPQARDHPGESVLRHVRLCDPDAIKELLLSYQTAPVFQQVTDHMKGSSGRAPLAHPCGKAETRRYLISKLPKLINQVFTFGAQGKIVTKTSWFCQDSAISDEGKVHPIEVNHHVRKFLPGSNYPLRDSKLNKA